MDAAKPLTLFDVNDLGPLSNKEGVYLQALAEGLKSHEAANCAGIDWENQKAFEQELKLKLGARTLPALIARALAFKVLRAKAIGAFLMCALCFGAQFQDQQLRRPPRAQTQASRRQEQLA